MATSPRWQDALASLPSATPFRTLTPALSYFSPAALQTVVSAEAAITAYCAACGEAEQDVADWNCEAARRGARAPTCCLSACSIVSACSPHGCLPPTPQLRGGNRGTTSSWLPESWRQPAAVGRSSSLRAGLTRPP